MLRPDFACFSLAILGLLYFYYEVKIFVSHTLTPRSCDRVLCLMMAWRKRSHFPLVFETLMWPSDLQAALLLLGSSQIHLFTEPQQVDTIWPFLFLKDPVP